MADLRELGARAHLFMPSGEDAGVAHLPPPVEPGDFAATEQDLFRVRAVVDCRPGSKVDALLEVEPARLTVVG